MASSVIVSANVGCYVNGGRFGKVKSFSWSSNTPKKAIYGIDSPNPVELAPTTTKVTGQMVVYRLIGDGGIEGAAMATRQGELPLEKYFSLALIVRSTKTVIFEANQCSVISQSWSVPEKGIVTGSISFECISWSNEMRNL